DRALSLMLAIAERRHRLARGLCRELGRRAVLVGAADEQNFVAELAVKAGVNVGRQKRAREIAEMLDAIDVRRRRGDQDPGHGMRPSREAHRTRGIKKPFQQRKGSGSALASTRSTRVNPSVRT